jgi:DnaA family protein
VRLADEATLDTFVLRPGLEALGAAAEAAGREYLSLVHGPAQTGKSHFLQAVCHRYRGALYLPLAELAGHPPAAVLADLEQQPLLALDDLHDVAGREDWEEALFHLVNRARAASCALWFAARRPPAELGVRLPDLRSRLAGGVVWSLPPPDDDAKIAILTRRARHRGLRLPEAVASYLATRGDRSLDALLGVLDRLDEASLRLQRPLTIPLVREVMGW